MSNYIISKCYRNHNLDGNDYEASVGSFAIAEPYKDGFRRRTAWENCRELFDATFSRVKTGILFFKDDVKGSDGHSQHIAAFFEQVEDKLNVQPRSEFIGLKHAKTVTAIRFSLWWKANYARRQLFTILLRCGRNYRKSFDRALFSEEYARKTKAAIKRFFDGHTNCCARLGGFDGWVWKFDSTNKDKNYLDKQLKLLTK